MYLIYIILLILVVFGISFNKVGINADYIGKVQCNAIKGICIVLVFIRHIKGYLDGMGYDDGFILERMAIFINANTMQYLVVPFLFFSGYGVAESLQEKGCTYVNSMPKKRLLSTLLNFDVAVVLFMVLNLILDRDFTLEEGLLSLIGWKSIGNSNWYIFAILFLYLATYLGYKHRSNTKPIGYSNGGMVMILLLVSVYVLAMILLKKPHWYNTIFCYPLGMFYSIYKKNCESYVTKNYSWLTIVLVVIFLISFGVTRVWMPFHIVSSLVLCALVICISMKVSFKNNALVWMGANLFPLYIYQRVPMLVLSSDPFRNFMSHNTFVYIISSILITLIFGYGYKYINIRVK